MGLDMYVYATKAKPDLSAGPDAEPLEWFHYWRKHYPLHDWMKALYLRKGGRPSRFNLGAVDLDGADLDQLEADLTNQEGNGLFSELTKAELADDLAFIREARQQLAEGFTVSYHPSW